MRYQVPSWWKPVADAARRRDHASAMSCIPRGEPFNAERYDLLAAEFWHVVETRGAGSLP